MIEKNVLIASWYLILTILFVVYATFSLVQFKHYRDPGARSVFIIFASLALGTFSIVIERAFGGFGVFSGEIWFYVNRASYVGILLGGWWLIDYRLFKLNGEGIPLRKLWRFWQLFCGSKTNQ